MTRKQKRLLMIAGLAMVLALAAALILTALRDEIVFFFSPTELSARPELTGEAIRIGGLVQDESWVRTGQENLFVITDGETEVNVTYVGLLPDLFREGQGVIAEGALGSDGQFLATSVLAKHDENYIPREIAQTLKDQGVWQGEQ